MEKFNWTVLVGGLAFFFFGLKSARQGLELVAGDRLRGTLGSLAGNRVSAFFFGALITIILQSSGASSAMLVSFAETGLVTLAQAIAVLIGADVGTTFVVILLSIREISNLALVIVSIGFLVEIMAKSRRTRDVGLIILGFGLIFYGMYLISSSAEPLRQSAIAMQAFYFLEGHPLATIILASLISALIHSAGTIGIAIALAFAGTISFETAIPIVLGANIGTCITAILAGFGSGSEGRRVALAHTLSKLIGVALIYPFIPRCVEAINFLDNFINSILPATGTSVAVKIAIAHISFNLLLAIIFLPLLTPLVKLVQHIIPSKFNKDKLFGPKYLDKSALDTPALAFAQTKREILRIGATAQWLFSDCLRMFSKGHDYREQVERIQSGNDRIDILEKAVRFYLAEISMERLSEDQAKTQLALLGIAADLEEVGDIMAREMAHLAAKKAQWHRVFSDEGWQDLRNFQVMVIDNFDLVMSMLAGPSEEIAKKIERHSAEVNETEQELKLAHINRLHQGLKEAFDTSSIHLDILSNLLRINQKLTHVSRLAMDTI